MYSVAIRHSLTTETMEFAINSATVEVYFVLRSSSKWISSNFNERAQYLEELSTVWLPIKGDKLAQNERNGM